MSHLFHSNTDSVSGIPFAKLHGLGNDFVLLDLRNAIAPKELFSKQKISSFSNRKTGVGFDQLIVLRKSKKGALAKVFFYNADGSKAEMCGNGLRAAALYCFLEVNTKAFQLESYVGMHDCEVLSVQKTKAHIRCTMGKPKVLTTPKNLKLKTTDVICVDVGNPHAVIFVYPKNEQEFLNEGARLEKHAAFPNRTNVQFVRLKNKTSLEALVWERGVGPTDACGTGAVACAVAAKKKWNLESNKIEIHYPGGKGIVHFEKKIWLESTAALVFTGLWIA